MGQSPNSKNYTSNPRDNILVQGNADLYNNRVLKRTFTTEVTKTADKDDILMSVRAPVGDIARNQYESIVIGRGIAAIKGNNFLYYQLEKMNNSGFWKKYIAGSTFESINGKDLKSSDIYISNYKEEKSIGNIFQTLTKTIQLHERKCEELALIKQALLQKLFPKKDEVIPEVRYKSFSAAWEQRKLGEVATRVTRKNKNLESTLPLTISAQLGLVDQISYFDKRIASSNLTNYILLNRGEFAYNKSYSNGYPFGAVKRLNRYDKGVIPSLYIAFMPNTIFINSDFMEMYFETSLWHKEVSARASEGARNHGLLNISPSDFMDIYMKIPEKIEEQKKIAKFLEDFDSLIALHQRKPKYISKLT